MERPPLAKPSGLGSFTLGGVPMQQEWISIASHDGGPNGDHYDAYLALPPAGLPGPAAVAGDLRRQPPHPRGGRAVRARRLRRAGARRVLAREAPRRAGLCPAPSASVRCNCSRRPTAAKARHGSRHQPCGAECAGRVRRPRRRVSATAWAAGSPAWRAAGGGIDALSCYYGGGIPDQSSEYAPRIACPIQFHYGERDARTSRQAPSRKAAFAGRADASSISTTPSTASTAGSAPATAPSSARAHARTLELFARTLFLSAVPVDCSASNTPGPAR